MAIEKIFAHLVYPNKSGEYSPPFISSEIGLHGKMFDLVQDLYDGSGAECNIDIGFKTSDQKHEVRELIINLIQKKNAVSAGLLADRLATVTTRRSSLGLFFVVLAKNDSKDVVLLSRFPTSEAILADDAGGGLNVEYLEKVFVKKWSSYKAAIFSDAIGRSNFWMGKVVDRQINAGRGEASLYWVEDFLLGEFLTTSFLGTQRFANALSAASRSAKGTLAAHEISSMIPFLAQFEETAVSADEAMSKIGVSKETKELVLKELPSGTSDKVFKFDYLGLRNQLSFRTITTDKGVSVTADSLEFQKLVSVSEEISDEGAVISTTGKILSDRLTKAR